METADTRVCEALTAAAVALKDLGACDDPDCRESNCNHALTRVREALASMSQPPRASGEATQSMADYVYLVGLLADIRAACGDYGRRMQDELVQYIAGLHDTLHVIADPRAELPEAFGRCRERIYEDMALEALKWTANTEVSCDDTTER